MGSGTTVRDGQRMARNSIGIEILPEYYAQAKAKLIEAQQHILFEHKETYETAQPVLVSS